MDKFMDGLFLALALLGGITLVDFAVHSRRSGTGRLVLSPRFRKALELRLVVFILLVPWLYLLFVHQNLLIWKWTILIVIEYFAAVIYSRKRLGTAGADRRSRKYR